ncbi:hypothetical protein GCM10010170_061410 [Dactylosporangium salmoneum]|uniref:DUF7691 domain-containing protein n=1 Tax=Dactylosporangium salmoneum TaxID=53361 RepID=A0ABN3GYI4_9ACTN
MGSIASQTQDSNSPNASGCALTSHMRTITALDSTPTTPLQHHRAVQPIDAGRAAPRRAGQYGVRIRLDALRDVLALRDESLAAWVVEHCGPDLTELDEWFETERPAADYMADLMLGRPHANENAHLYGYCVKVLCELWGAPMANDGWWGMRYGWFDAVTKTVAQAGVTYDFTDLIIGGPGADVPPPDDFPAMGHITRDDLQAHLDLLSAPELARIDDQDVVTAVEQVRSWLRECRREDTDLVCFYH